MKPADMPSTSNAQESSPVEPQTPTPAAAHAGNLGTGAEAGCTCGKSAAWPEAFVYAIGKVEVRFPSLGIEREYRQLERQSSAEGVALTLRAERMAKILSAHTYLARQLCYVLVISGIPAYILVPTSADTLAELIEALRKSAEEDAYTLVVGRRGPVAQPAQCAGVIASIVACDTSYAFTISEWAKGLGKIAAKALHDRKIGADTFQKRCREQFLQFLGIENMGATEAHRAINYLLMRHPGPALAALERTHKVLDQIESRVLMDVDIRRIVLVIFTFVDAATGVPERLFCRIDVTDEFPFVADAADLSAPPLGLLPYIDQRDSSVF